eukprot:6482786-Amphidinium_carterae.3
MKVTQSELGTERRAAHGLEHFYCVSNFRAVGTCKMNNHTNIVKFANVVRFRSVTLRAEIRL